MVARHDPIIFPVPQPGRIALFMGVGARRGHEGVEARHCTDERLEADEIIAPDTDVGLPNR